MSRHYGLPVRVKRDAATGRPRSFVWRGVTWRVREVLSTWHLMARWWEATNPDHPRGGTTDRLCYRVLCQEFAIFEIYFDRAQNTWVLDRVQD